MKLIIGLIIAILIVYLSWYFVAEHAVFTAPPFEDSILTKYRGELKDSTGMSVNDYVLQKNIRGDLQIGAYNQILT